MVVFVVWIFFFFQAEDGIRDDLVTGVQTCALPICPGIARCRLRGPTGGTYLHCWPERLWQDHALIRDHRAAGSKRRRGGIVREQRWPFASQPADPVSPGTRRLRFPAIQLLAGADDCRTTGGPAARIRNET